MTRLRGRPSGVTTCPEKIAGGTVVVVVVELDVDVVVGGSVDVVVELDVVVDETVV